MDSKLGDLTDPTTTENLVQPKNSGDSESKDYSCERCCKSFTTKKYLRSHMKTIHESPRLFICPLCGKQLAREKGLNQHVRTIHEGNWSVFCSICGKGFINRCRLKKHCTNVHERSNRFPCPICDKGFTSDVYRIQHMDLVHSGCDDECEAMAKFDASELKTTHYKPTASSSLSQSYLLSTYAQPSSSDDQPLDLSIRKRPSDSPEIDKSSEVGSQRVFTEPVQQPSAIAEVSSTSFDSTRCVNDLVSGDPDDSSQSKEKGGRHNCTYCEKSFASKEYLRLHEATVHEGTKAFICSTCGKHFSVHQALRKHYVIQHEGGKPYHCRVCKMEFRTRANLRSHRSMIHGHVSVRRT